MPSFNRTLVTHDELLHAIEDRKAAVTRKDHA